MAFKNNNAVYGIPSDTNFQVGVSDVDPSKVGEVENTILLPYPANPEFTWVYFECNVTAMLDSGIVVHNRLPQVDNAADTLATCDYADPNLPAINTAGFGGIGGGVNLRCKDQYTDIVQRMGHSRYWFRLYGKALRVGCQVPIPSLKFIGGVPAIPYDKNPQWAFNRIVPGGNYGGVILWHAAWSLWYTTAVPPRYNTIPAQDPSCQIDLKMAASPPPAGIQAPYTAPDDNAVTSAPKLNNAQLIPGNTQASSGNNAQITP